MTKLTHEDVNSLEIVLEKANHEQYVVNQDGHKQFKFYPLECKSKFICNSHGSYGVFQASHCCFFCITAIHNQELTHELALKKGYCLTCVEHAISPSKDVIYFCASFLLRSCLKVGLILYVTIAISWLINDLTMQCLGNQTSVSSRKW